MLSPSWEQVESEDNVEEIIDDEKYKLISENFLKEIEMAYKEAVHLKEFGYAKARIPPWFWLILLILGWNELL